jgi:AAA+ superfamily predicted ATPase
MAHKKYNHTFKKLVNTLDKDGNDNSDNKDNKDKDNKDKKQSTETKEPVTKDMCKFLEIKHNTEFDNQQFVFPQKNTNYNPNLEPKEERNKIIKNDQNEKSGENIIKTILTSIANADREEYKKEKLAENSSTSGTQTRTDFGPQIKFVCPPNCSTCSSTPFFSNFSYFQQPPPFFAPGINILLPIQPLVKSETESKQMITDIQTVNIDVEINSLDDLIKMINDNPIIENVKYNIDIRALHKIKPNLIELKNMIGMKDLKNNVIDQILYFAQNLHKNNKNKIAEGDFMHTVIYGPPGTGKTEVAKILGKIFSKLGVLQKGTFKKATRSDLIAGYLGQTAIKTKELINSCIGGVLFIDEAYALGNEEKRDSFSKECIDTLCEALSDHKDKIMVIVAGYEKELDDCFFSYNQGLNSRFTWRFKTDDYTSEELMQIFIKKVNDNGWSLHDKSDINVKWFEDNKKYFKFYGRDMETLFSKTKIAHGRRVFCKSPEEKTKITKTDLEKGFNMFLSNEEVKRRKNESELEKNIKFSMYN